MGAGSVQFTVSDPDASVMPLITGSVPTGAGWPGLGEAKTPMEPRRGRGGVAGRGCSDAGAGWAPTRGAIGLIQPVALPREDFAVTGAPFGPLRPAVGLSSGRAVGSAVAPGFGRSVEVAFGVGFADLVARSGSGDAGPRPVADGDAEGR